MELEIAFWLLVDGDIYPGSGAQVFQTRDKGLRTEGVPGSIDPALQPFPDSFPELVYRFPVLAKMLYQRATQRMAASIGQGGQCDQITIGQGFSFVFYSMPGSSGKGACFVEHQGVGFGKGGEGFVRFALIENEQRATQAVRNLKRALTKLDAPS